MKAKIIFNERHPIGDNLVTKTRAIMIPRQSLLIIVVWLEYLDDQRSLPLEPRTHVEFMTNEAMAIRIAIQDADTVHAALRQDLGIVVRDYMQKSENRDFGLGADADVYTRLQSEYEAALATMRTKWSDLA